MTDSGLIPPELKIILGKSPSSDVLQKLTLLPTLRPFLTYLSCVECILALDGEGALLDRDLAPGALALWDSLAHATQGSTTANGFQSKAGPPPELSRFINPNDPLVPQFKGKSIGAAALLEFFAIMVEFSNLSNQGEGLIDSSDLLGQDFYFLISSIFFGEFFLQDLSDRKLPAFPVELEAAVDLALCLPLTPAGVMCRNQPLTWFDIHPGWRFLRICLHYQSTQPSWTTIPPDDDSFANYDSAFVRIQNGLCQELGWPTVTEVETSWSRFLDHLTTRETLHPLAWDLRGSGRVRIATHLLKERTASPYSMYLKRRSSAVDRELFFPAVISPEGMTAFNGIHWQGTEGQPTNWDELLMFTGCRFFAEGYPGHPHFRRDSAIGSGELFSRCAHLFDADQDHVENVLASYLNLDSYHRFERAMTRTRQT